MTSRFVLLLLLLIALVSGITTEAQAWQTYHTKSSKSVKKYEEASAMIRRRMVFQAIDELEELVKKDTDFVEAHDLLGSCYLQINQTAKAAEHFKAVRKLDPAYKRSKIGIQLADLLIQQGEFDESLQLLEELGTNLSPDMLQFSDQLKKQARFAKALKENPIEFNPEQLPAEVNRFPTQYFPVLTVDARQLIFTARKGLTPQYDEDIYIATRDETGKWIRVAPISDQINSYANEGTCSVSADGRTLILTICNRQDGVGGCDLYICYKNGEAWSKPENIGPVVNSQYWESQPSLSADGRTLYFCSERPGGMGRTDIWKSSLDDEDKWGKPVNLGPVINTAMDELSPFIHVNGQNLYFASNGHKGLGGFDLFVSSGLKNTWTEPKNLGYPLNSPEDEVSLFISADGTEGFYSYEEAPDPSKPIQSYLYRFDVPDEISVDNRSSFLKGRIYDEKTGKNLEAQIAMYLPEKNELVSRFRSDPVTGEYVTVLTEGADYALYIKKPGYLFKSLHFESKEGLGQEPQVLDIPLQPVETGATTVLNNIFFDTDSYVIKDESQLELRTLIDFLELNPERRIIIRGHTDNVGAAAYNQTLSENRAKAVYDFLIAEGITESRIRYKGLGQSEPIGSNDTEEGRQANRRIDFKIF